MSFHEDISMAQFMIFRTMISVLTILFGVTGCVTSAVQPPAIKECSEVLRYRAEHLGTVIFDMNRCFGTSIFMADETIARTLLSGTVLRADVNGWLDGLEFSFPELQVDRAHPHRVLIRTRVPGDPPGKK
jgi:hypothetical protein